VLDSAAQMAAVRIKADDIPVMLIYRGKAKRGVFHPHAGTG
jgi:hypothetical protein